MPRSKGSKNLPKTNTNYSTQIAEKQETIASLNTEIVSIQKAIEEQKNTLKEKKTALKKAEKEVACRVWNTGPSGSWKTHGIF